MRHFLLVSVVDPRRFGTDPDQSDPDWLALNADPYPDPAK
jgi:hypothetical protein